MFVYNIFERGEEKNNTEKRGRKKFLDEVTELSSMPISGGGVPPENRLNTYESIAVNASTVYIICIILTTSYQC